MNGGTGGFLDNNDSIAVGLHDPKDKTCLPSLFPFRPISKTSGSKPCSCRHCQVAIRRFRPQVNPGFVTLCMDGKRPVVKQRRLRTVAERDRLPATRDLKGQVCEQGCGQRTVEYEIRVPFNGPAIRTIIMDPMAIVSQCGIAKQHDRRWRDGPAEIGICWRS